MSSLIVPIAAIDAVMPHPNADRLEIAVIKGWQVIVSKGTYQPGDRVIYVPPDAVVPLAWSDQWNVTKYLQKGRVRCARLRGEPSFGFTAPITDLPTDQVDWQLDDNVADVFGITKYEPPFTAYAEDAVRAHPLFVKYTEIENLRHFPDVLRPGEEVILTEKVHGANARIGSIEGEIMAGSHRVRRRRPVDLRSSLYWFPFSIPGVESLVTALGTEHRQVILFGEVYGRVQSLRYGVEDGLDFRAFDLLVDGKYLNWDDFKGHCGQHDVPVVPEIHRGAFSLDEIRASSEGPTLVGGTHYREGVVVHPVVERHDERVDRVILKYASDTFLLGGKDEPVSGVDA